MKRRDIVPLSVTIIYMKSFERWRPVVLFLKFSEVKICQFLFCKSLRSRGTRNKNHNSVTETHSIYFVYEIFHRLDFDPFCLTHSFPKSGHISLTSFNCWGLSVFRSSLFKATVFTY